MMPLKNYFSAAQGISVEWLIWNKKIKQILNQYEYHYYQRNSINKKLIK